MSARTRRKGFSGTLMLRSARENMLGSGNRWTVWRPSGSGLTEQGERTLMVVKNDLGQFAHGDSEGSTWSSTYLAYTTLDVDVRVNDTVVQGTLAFRLNGVPDTDYGILVIPCEPTRVPS